MLDVRQQGLRTLKQIILVAFIFFNFLGLTALFAEVVEMMGYRQVNFPLYLSALFVAGLFFGTLHPGDPLDQTRQLAGWLQDGNRQTLILAACVFGVVFSTKDQAISRIFIGVYLLTTWIGLLALNYALPIWLSRISFGGDTQIRTLLVGKRRAIQRMSDWIRLQQGIGVRLVGRLSPGLETETAAEAEEKDEARFGKALPVLGETDDLADVLAEHRVRQVILADPATGGDDARRIAEICQNLGCRLLILNPWEPLFDQRLIPVSQGPHTFFTFQEEPLENPVNRLLKRLLDVAVALPVVLFVLPVFCLVVGWVQRRQAPGPLFFSQERSGRQQERFRILKFRTMAANNPDEARQASPGDDRVFPLGNWLRRTSMDELPQFLNVLRGEMSVVGPRPHMLDHDRAFSDIVSVYRTRHFVKPGITGLAQVNGLRGEITDRTKLEARVRYDLDYISNWSLWLDISLIFRTAWQVLFPPPTAY
ncbi:MAG: sugar transferase [Opitutales bacterium]